MQQTTTSFCFITTMDYKTQTIPLSDLPSYMLQSDIVKQHMKEQPTNPFIVPIGLIGVPYVPKTMEAHALDEFLIAYRFANWLMLGCPVEFMLYIDICDVDCDTLQTNLDDSPLRQMLENYIKTRKQIELPANERFVYFVDETELVIIMQIHNNTFKATINVQQFLQSSSSAENGNCVIVNYVSYGILLNKTMRICHMMLFVNDELCEHSFVAHVIEK